MRLNIRTPKDATKEYLGLRVYGETLAEIEVLAARLNVKKSVLVRHAINEFLDSMGEAND